MTPRSLCIKFPLTEITYAKVCICRLAEVPGIARVIIRLAAPAHQQTRPWLNMRFALSTKLLSPSKLVLPKLEVDLVST